MLSAGNVMVEKDIKVIVLMYPTDEEGESNSANEQ